MEEKITNILNERISIYNDAVKLKKPKRVPTLDTATSWKIYHSELKPKPTVTEAVSDYTVTEKVLREHIERYNFDALSGASITNGHIAKIIGMEKMLTQVYDDERMVQALSVNFMKDDELEEFGNNQIAYTWTKVFPRRFPEGLTYKQIKQLAQTVTDEQAYHAHINEVTLNEYGIPNMLGAGWIMQVTEYLFQAYQGIDGFSKIMRRKAKELKALCEKTDNISESMFDDMLSAPNENCIFDISTTFLAPSVMSTKQFEEFYWPLIKSGLEKTVCHDKKMYIFVEGDILRFADYFKEIQGGHLAVSIEMDDIFDVRKKLPNVCLIGGMNVDCLGKSTKEACLNRAKQLCDNLGGSGYIFSPNKLLAYPNDSKPENLKAVQDFVLNYNL